MRSVYDNMQVAIAANPTTASSTGVVTTGPGIDTKGYNSACLRVFTTPVGSGLSVANGSSITAVVQESNDNGATDAFAAAADNTGGTIGSTVQVTTTAVITSYRLEGLGLNRKRYLRVKLTHNLGGTALANVYTSSAVLELGRAYQNPVSTSTAVLNT